MTFPPGFVEEISYNELDFGRVVGRGTFGTVSRARWRGTLDVALKVIETELEQRAFITELKQLSRVHHRNIVKLIGACTRPPLICLVMEYAEGGSLYNVLHPATGVKLTYTCAHAISWCLQCAEGVAYLHSLKPKPLLHRDLKPPNLLLMHGGTLLKICDFGTACDETTYMTNNKGSAAWMAPEVFEGTIYSAKCDVYSWGIILWQTLSRHKPFDDIGGNAFQIMWAVHRGTRPPLIKDCPKPIEDLMTRCWSQNPVNRPTMVEVVRVMTAISKFFTGGDDPLAIPTQDLEAERRPSAWSTPALGPHYGVTPMAHAASAAAMMAESRGNTLLEPIFPFTGSNAGGERIPFVAGMQVSPYRPLVTQSIVESRRTSAPSSLATSRENLLAYERSPSSTIAGGPNAPSASPVTGQAGAIPPPGNKRYSTDLSGLSEATPWLELNPGGMMPVPVPQAEASPKPAATAFQRGHRRVGSHGSPATVVTNNFLPPNLPSFSQLEPILRHQATGSSTAQRGHRRSGSFGTLEPAVLTTTSQANVQINMQHTSTAPANLNQMTIEPTNLANGVPNRSVSWSTGQPTNAYMSNQMAAAIRNFVRLESHLQPLQPCEVCPESMTIFKQHCELAEEYVKVLKEIDLYRKLKLDMEQELKRDELEQIESTRFVEEYAELMSENDSLKTLQETLQNQIELIRSQQGVEMNGGGAPQRK